MNSAAGLIDDPSVVGSRMHAFASRLYPLCRSITGAATLQTLEAIRSEIGIEIVSLPTGAQVFDWQIPDEWNLGEAWIRDPSGNKIVDVRNHSLHILNYSEPVNRKMRLSELKEHLFSLPEQPDLIPYRTSYYKRDWGFCIRHSLLESLEDGEYEVCIDSTLQPGHLHYGELLIPGETTDEVLLSTHVCHPSLANDNLSGIALLTELARDLSDRSARYSYRFLFVPGTIGSIAWLAKNKNNVAKIQHGLVVACVGDSGRFQYKRSRRNTAEIDRLVEHLLRRSGEPYSVRDFSPYGYDERQYCSPGFDLPVGSLTRTPHGQFPEYHTSADNLEFISAVALGGSFLRYTELVSYLEANRRYRNQNPYCEPQLGRRGLYRMMGGYSDARDDQMAMLWMLNLSDGNHSILDIAERTGMAFERLASVAKTLEREGLLRQEGPGQ